MKYAVERAHRDHFTRHGYVEFEGLLKVSFIEQAFAALPPCTSLKESIEIGRDLWRSNELFRILALNRRLAALAAELTNTQTLRLAYDQMVMAKGEYLPFLEPWSLQQRSAFSEVACGLLIALQPKIAGAHYPAQKGNGAYIHPTMPLDWSALMHEEGVYWLLVYVHASSRYVCNVEDPHVHLPKRLGYAFGDALQEGQFPLVYSQ